MLLRREKDSALAITQPRHAWLAGELARAWDKRHEPSRPWDAIVCAAALHDMGWFDWEATPQLDSATGLPLEFQNVPAEIHTGLWRQGVERASFFDDYVALLVSRHGDAIYEMTFDEASARPEAAAAVRAFRTTQHDLQRRLIERLATDPGKAAALSEEQLMFAKRFIVAVDTISLHLCWGIGDRVIVADVPGMAGGFDKIALSARSRDEIVCDPWPFQVERIRLPIEGKRVSKPFPDERAMRRFLQEAPSIQLSMMLRPI